MAAYSILYDPYAKYDIGYLSKKYKNRSVKEYRVPNEKEGMHHLLDLWHNIYFAQKKKYLAEVKEKTDAGEEPPKPIIPRGTYYCMKGHIRHLQFEIFFNYIRHLSVVIDMLSGLESGFHKFMETKSIEVVPEYNFQDSLNKAVSSVGTYNAIQ